MLAAVGTAAVVVSPPLGDPSPYTNMYTDRQTAGAQWHKVLINGLYEVEEGREKKKGGNETVPAATTTAPTTASVATTSATTTTPSPTSHHYLLPPLLVFPSLLESE